MTVEFCVTFEFESRPALTLRGTVAASSAATCVARATRNAQQVLRPVNWRSVVCVLLGGWFDDRDAVPPMRPSDTVTQKEVA